MIPFIYLYPSITYHQKRLYCKRERSEGRRGETKRGGEGDEGGRRGGVNTFNDRVHAEHDMDDDE